MKEARFAVTTLALLAIAGAYAMPRNSYLVRPAKTHGALMQQFRTEAVVADRYMRHFGMERQEMEAYLGTLKLGRLDKTEVHMIYAVPKSGQLHGTPQLLKRGTLVWEDGSGQPILLEICGNPFTQGPKRTTMTDVISLEPAEPAPLAAMSTLPQVAVISAPVAMTMQPITPTAPIVIDPIVEPAMASRNDLGWILAIPAAGALLLDFPRGDEPVPEPASMTAMAIGAGYMALKRRRNKKS